MRISTSVRGVTACLFVTSCLPSTVPANNIDVANVALVEQDLVEDTARVKFDLSWENSWRGGQNWDAAWVFVKFRAPGSNNWQHAALGAADGDHQPAPGSRIDAVPDGRGVFVYRSAAGTGDVSWAGTELLWTYGSNGYAFAKGDMVDVAVHAIEMVYVPQGAFYVGSGGTEYGRLFTGETVNDPYLVASEDAIPTTNAAGCLWGSEQSGNRSMGGEGLIPAAFPKGYAAFYAMKHEISQGQYAAFLSTLDATQAGNRFPNMYGNYRHTIREVDEAYVADRPDRACNYLSSMDGCAYAAWAGLRPMTELEFEKACRGPATPLADEYPWGTTTVMADQSRTLSGAEDGTDRVISPSAAAGGANYNNKTHLGGDGGNGPLRCGIFATNGATRVSAGAGYYGMLDLGGSLWERCVTIGNDTGRGFEGSLGSGELNSLGHATNSDWPGYSGGAGVTGATGSGCRAGYWSYAARCMYTSDREHGAYTSTLRENRGGFRCARQAP